MLIKHNRNLTKRGYNANQVNRQLKKLKFSMRANKALKINNTHTSTVEAPLEPINPPLSRGTAQPTCDTPCVVYLIQCKICGLQYVGQTLKSLKARFAKHIQAIGDRQKRGVLQEHCRYGRCGNINNIKLQMLHTLTPGDNDTPRQTEETLKQLETLWINRLRSEFPQGLNCINYDSTVRY